MLSQARGRPPTRASDLHLEPEEDCIRVRHRLDGHLQTIVILPRTQLQRIVARLKILAQMDISETRKPQDGAARLRVDGRLHELRLSTLPAVHGETVEIKLPGNTQVQVLDAAGRSYATTLRAMLRQDPDVLMVGEIRDLETAETACRAALTGHLVLSTLHTRDAFGAFDRLLDMGVPRSIIIASFNAVLISDWWNAPATSVLKTTCYRPGSLRLSNSVSAAWPERASARGVAVWRADTPGCGGEPVLRTGGGG